MKRSRRRLGLVGLVVFLAAYVTVVVLYADVGCGCPKQLTEGRAPGGTMVTIDVEEIQSVKGALTANVTVAPGPELLDPATGLKDDLAVAVHSAVTPTKRSWTKGMVPGVFPVPLTISGDPSEWPFDHFQSGPVTVDLFRGNSPVPQRVSVNFVDRLPGWQVFVRSGGRADVPEPYRVEVQRSSSTAAFAAVILGVFVALAGLALFVAVQTVRDRRKFQPPMTTWYAAMLFAVVPLRNALPDAPPIGSWIDVTVVLWVIVILVTSMLLYVTCWWRHTAPDPPANPAESLPSN